MKAKSNPGWVVHRAPDPRVGPAFLLVVGSPRGGTTLVAHTLASLGVFMGEKLPYTVEDPHLAGMAEGGDWKGLREVFERRGLHHVCWGWKYPPILMQPKGLELLPANTRLIFIFRDFLATAMRDRMVNASDIVGTMAANLKYQQAMLDFGERSLFPLFMASYEKALLGAAPFVRGLAEFAGLDSQSPNVARAIARVKPSPASYQPSPAGRDTAGDAGFKNCLDFIRPDFVSGWAFLEHAPQTPVEIELFREDGSGIQTTADLLRRDLAESGLHPDGHCGFRFKLGGHAAIQPGELIQLRLAGGPAFTGGPFVASF